MKWFKREKEALKHEKQTGGFRRFPFDFKADKGRYTLNVNCSIEKSLMLEFFEHAKQKAKQLKGVQVTQDLEEIIMDDWEMPPEHLGKIQNKLLTKIRFTTIIAMVKKDLPNFKALSQKLEKISFTKKYGANYEAQITVIGVCVGDD